MYNECKSYFHGNIIFVCECVRPAPRVFESRVATSNMGNAKSPHALGVFSVSEAGTTSSANQIIAARGEADGSPAPLSDFPYSAAAGSETATPASSVTPSLTSPTSISITSSSPQPPYRGIAEGRRALKDFSDSLSVSSHRSQIEDQQEPGVSGAGSRKQSLSPSSRADDTDQGESDLDSPNQ